MYLVRRYSDNRVPSMVEQAASTEDFAEHEKTYRYFVRGVLLFAAHVLLILLILAWIFSDRFGNAPLTG